MKAVIFDFDGTIADSLPNIYKIVNKVLQKYRYPQIEKDKFLELRNQNTITILKNSKIPFYKLPFMMNLGHKLISQQADEIKPFKGVEKLIEELKNLNFVVGIISSNSKATIDIFLEKNNFPKIDFLYTSKNIFGKEKMIKNCLRKYELDNNETFYVGDEVRDIEASKTNEIKCIAVTWGFNSKVALENAKADFIAKEPANILNFLNTK